MTAEAWGTKTAKFRALPDFVVVGAQRSGTSSLHFTLSHHPGIRLSRIKEIRYFDIHFEFPLEWYRGQFPTYLGLRLDARRQGVTPRVGESSPDYLFYPWAPGRMVKV